MSRAGWAAVTTSGGWLIHGAHLVTVVALGHEMHAIHVVLLVALTAAVTVAAVAVLLEPVRQRVGPREQVDPETQAAIHHIGERLRGTGWGS